LHFPAGLSILARVWRRVLLRIEEHNAGWTQAAILNGHKTSRSDDVKRHFVALHREIVKES
jgi:hypothetical protein